MSRRKRIRIIEAGITSCLVEEGQGRSAGSQKEINSDLYFSKLITKLSALIDIAYLKGYLLIRAEINFLSPLGNSVHGHVVLCFFLDEI